MIEIDDQPISWTITAFKKAERTDNYIIRFAEQKGQETMAKVRLNPKYFKFKEALACNGLENAMTVQ